MPDPTETPEGARCQYCDGPKADPGYLNEDENGRRFTRCDHPFHDSETPEGREAFGSVTYRSVLSANTVTVEIVRGRLEVTFEGRNSSWGESLSEADTAALLRALTPDLGSDSEADTGLQSQSGSTEWRIRFGRSAHMTVVTEAEAREYAKPGDVIERRTVSEWRPRYQSLTHSSDTKGPGEGR